jgi:nucleotide-binding universal stress UspA family protein
MIVQHVLVPIDFSATADQALAYAIALAQQLHARLTLVHVFHLTPLAIGEMDTAMPATYLDDLETEAHQLLQASRDRVQHAGLQGESLLVQGSPAQAIVDTAGAQGVDLIIMGTHGRTGLAHVFLGSVAEHVVRQGPCPVLVVRRAPDTSAPAEAALPEQP